MTHNKHHEDAYFDWRTKTSAFTIPALVFSVLMLVRQLKSQDGDVIGEEVPATTQKIFQLLNQTIETLSLVPSSEQALRLYLQCAEYSAKLLKKPDQCTAGYACSPFLGTPIFSRRETPRSQLQFKAWLS
ncbi:hypothetical protein RJ641_028849 [Dillenia turbinata]|uniref:Uncharacterized protein n=1 Tax=Dillenia turbinata TaxID=194707 RepID=A0AAN8ZM63_9MAGN